MCHKYQLRSTQACTYFVKTNLSELLSYIIVIIKIKSETSVSPFIVKTSGFRKLNSVSLKLPFVKHF